MEIIENIFALIFIVSSSMLLVWLGFIKAQIRVTDAMRRALDKIDIDESPEYWKGAKFIIDTIDKEVL